MMWNYMCFISHTMWPVIVTENLNSASRNVAVEWCRMEWTGWHFFLATSCMAYCVMIWVLAKHCKHCAYWLVITTSGYGRFRFGILLYSCRLELLCRYRVTYHYSRRRSHASRLFIRMVTSWSAPLPRSLALVHSLCRAQRLGTSCRRTYGH